MEFSKGILQFTYATTELFNLGMEFSGVRENKAVKAGRTSGRRFSNCIRAGQSKDAGRLNVYFRVPYDVPIAPMTDKSPVWTDGATA